MDRFSAIFSLTLLTAFASAQYDQSGNCCENYCYRLDDNPYVNFATKTSYDFVYGKQSNQHIVPRCKPIQFWSLNRHGTRLPGNRAIENLRRLSTLRNEIVNNYDQRRSYPDRGRMCDQDLDLFRRWRWNETIVASTANDLTSQGAQELRLLAMRYKTRFRDLVGTAYATQSYKFQYTNTDRTYSSYQAYVNGLFSNDASRTHADVSNEDPLLRKYKSCARWQAEVDDNVETLTEYVKFKESETYKELARDVFTRLGFKYILNTSFIEDMYDMCRYEKAWYPMSPSTWCAAFTKEQLKILEYSNDLIDYYRLGYGNEMNIQLGCPPLKDMYDRFEATIRGNSNEPKVVVYFTHSATIQLFLTAMGLNRDQTPLTADNYYTQTRRKWRTSQISPFSANFAAVLYECDQEERNRVLFLLNEKPVEYLDCDVGLCSWSSISEKLRDSAYKCNLEFCDSSALNNKCCFELLLLIICFSVLKSVIF